MVRTRVVPRVHRPGPFFTVFTRFRTTFSISAVAGVTVGSVAGVTVGAVAGGSV